MNRFQCPRCKGALRAAAPGQVACAACGAGYDANNGILDLAGSIQVASGQAGHKRAAAAWLERVAVAAGERWPDMLGVVLQIGCGTLSGALIAGGQTGELAIIDPSLAGLADDRSAIEQAGLLGRLPLSFAACQPGACLRDVSFDTCISLTALERSDDPRRLLAELFRCLKPGGRALLIAPNRRYHRALGATLADIIGLQCASDPTPNPDRDRLAGQLALMRLTDLHPDVAGRGDLIDPESVAEAALHQGFDTAETLPLAPDADGSDATVALLEAQAAGPGYADATLALLPGFRRRYFDLLHPADRSAASLLWLTKPVGPRLRTFRVPTPDRPLTLVPGHEMASLAGGLPVRCWLDLAVQQTQHGVVLAVAGWCLANVDIVAVRVTIDGRAGEAPVWRARSDVQQTLNPSGLYTGWNALCSGVDTTVAYEALRLENGSSTLSVAVILANGSTAHVPCAERIRPGETLRVVA